MKITRKLNFCTTTGSIHWALPMAGYVWRLVDSSICPGNGQGNDVVSFYVYFVCLFFLLFFLLSMKGYEDYSQTQFRHNRRQYSPGTGRGWVCVTSRRQLQLSWKWTGKWCGQFLRVFCLFVFFLINFVSQYERLWRFLANSVSARPPAVFTEHCRWHGVCDVSSTAPVVLEMDWKIGLHFSYSPTWVLLPGVSWRCVERFPSFVGQRFLD